MKTCKDCRFWEEQETDAPQNGVTKGTCHRYPPKAMGTFAPKVNIISGQVEPQYIELTVWACTNSVSWCGEFEPITKEALDG